MSLSRPGLVIFDCDGTLVDSETISNRTLFEAGRDLGLPWTEEETAEKFLGLTLDACLEIAEAALGKKIPADFIDRMQAETFKRLAAEVEEIPGARDLVHQVKAANIPICVASNGEKAKMDVTLARTGMLDVFDGHIYSAVDDPVSKGKPDPALFLFAARQMGVAPADSVVIEDSVPGVEAGLAAGMAVIGLHIDGSRRVDSLAEIPALIGL